jgi:hypothetical protein
LYEHLPNGPEGDSYGSCQGSGHALIRAPIVASPQARCPTFRDQQVGFHNLFRMIKIAQTFSIWQSKMDSAVGRRNEEETDLRLRHQRWH